MKANKLTNLIADDIIKKSVQIVTNEIQNKNIEELKPYYEETFKIRKIKIYNTKFASRLKILLSTNEEDSSNDGDDDDDDKYIIESCESGEDDDDDNKYVIFDIENDMCEIEKFKDEYPTFYNQLKNLLQKDKK